jgi:translocation and assembly module TamA
MRGSWRAHCCALLLALAALPARADITVNITGVDGDAQLNVLTRLSVERYRERKDVDADVMQRLFNRIDEEVKDALRPFGFYEPVVRPAYKAVGKNWEVTIAIEPGEPVRVRELNVSVVGPGAEDPAFDSVKSQDLLRIGMTLRHGAYENVKGEMMRIAAANGYLASQMESTVLDVDRKAHSARIELTLQTGPQYNFGKIDIEQKAIRPGLMQRYVRFREGQPYSATQVLNTQFALEDSLFFSDVVVDAGEADADTLTVPVRITAGKSRSTFSIGGGYGTDTQVRGTLGWTDTRVNDRGHRFRIEIKGSAKLRQINSRYDIPIGDPALERISLELENNYREIGDLDNTTTTLRPSITRMASGWQTVSSVAAIRTTTREPGAPTFTSNLLVPGIVVASVPKGFLGEELFSRALYVELLGSTKALGSDSNFTRILVQSERNFDLTSQWHWLLRGEAGASVVDDFSELPGIYRFFAGGDRSVRGFAFESLSPKNAEGVTVGGRHMLVGSTELVRDIPWNLAIAGFFDIGNAFDKFKDVSMEYSVGMGLRYRLPGVSIGLDVAKPLSYSNSKVRVHLNISPKL